MIEIAPSVLAADTLRIGEEVQRVLDAGADMLHVDIMDAHFVPNLSYGPDLCRALRRGFPDIRQDVHLMMDNPEHYIEAFAAAGANEITIHVELGEKILQAIEHIKSLGCKAGLSVKPGTPADSLLPYLSLIDLILIMTVEPGFGGQKMMPEQLDKAAFLREKGFCGIISADGGIGPDNAEPAIKKGVTRLVMGTSLFRAPDAALAVVKIRALETL